MGLSGWMHWVFLAWAHLLAARMANTEWLVRVKRAPNCPSTAARRVRAASNGAPLFFLAFSGRPKTG
eukprot:11282181-Alexandrium_andersonii.AAC.1